jgi:glycosyltransferase involved in cell wall biosynthesis
MTGGEKYNFVMVHYLEEKGTDVQILQLCEAPQAVSGTGLWNHLLSNVWWCPTLISRNVRGTLFVLDSYSHSRIFLPTLILSLFKRARLLAICHHLAYHDLTSRFRRAIDRPLEAFSLRLMDRVITVSESAREELGSLGVDIDRITIIKNGVDPQMKWPQHWRKAEIRKNAFQVLFVGTCGPRKGLIYLLQAVGLLPRQCQVCVHIVGNIEDDPAYYRSLVDFLDREALREKVFFHGRISDAELAEMYASADVFVLPSLWEGYGIVLLEAMVHGLPIVASRVGAIPELVRHGENGWLVPPGDSQALAEAIWSLTQDQSLCNRLGDRGRELSRQFPTWDEVAEQFRQVLLNETCL